MSGTVASHSALDTWADVPGCRMGCHRDSKAAPRPARPRRATALEVPVRLGPYMALSFLGQAAVLLAARWAWS
jgi:hypothetical protein